jgi:hypothetical protein
LQHDEALQRLEQRLRAALALDPDAPVALTEVHDAMTTLRTHGKAIPEAVSPELLAAVEREATHRMAAIVRFCPSIHPSICLLACLSVLLCHQSTACLPASPAGGSQGGCGRGLVSPPLDSLECAGVAPEGRSAVRRPGPGCFAH